MRDLRFRMHRGDLRDLRGLPASLSRAAVATPRRVLAGSIALVVVMGVATGVFARAYHAAEERRARDQFEAGQAANSAGRAAEAVDRYRAAIALDRDEPTYRRELAITLLSLRRIPEAETHLTQLLERDPVDGQTNLLLARIAASRGAFEETEAFYQRAIYGRWAGADDAAARRVAARFELIAWLVQMDAKAPARGELLHLQAELPDVPFLQRQLARELLDLDLPAQAAAILTRELARQPTDARIAGELVKAEMAAGRFIQARNAARRALALDARDSATRDRLDQITQVLALDPSQHGLTPADRFERSQRLLRRVVADLDACAASGLPQDEMSALANARVLLANAQALGASAAQNQSEASPDATVPRVTAASLQSRADARVTAAEDLWAVRVARCGPSPGALAWIFDRLSR